MSKISSIDSHPKRMGGKYCLKRTRFPAAQILAELAGYGEQGHSNSLADISDNFELDLPQLRKFLNELALLIDNEYEINAKELFKAATGQLDKLDYSI